METAVDEPGAVLLFEIDSPGGAVHLLEDLLKRIGEARSKGVRTIAWVRGNAWSAAAILAIACDRIYMNRSSSMGAALPVFISPVPTDGKPANSAGEKHISAIRTEARSYAESAGRSPALAEAMVDPDTVVYAVSVRGERRFVTDKEWEEIENRAFKEGFDATIDATVIEAGKLLSLTASQALEYGFVDGTATALQDVLEAEGLAGAEVMRTTLTWSQVLANFLTAPLVAIVLLIVGVGGIYVEIKAPGFGLPGILGILALFLFFFGKYAVGLAEIYEILLFFTGVGLIAVEVFVTPGFGIPGIAGILLMLAGLLLSSQDFLVPSNQSQWTLFRFNLIYTFISLGGAVVLLVILGTFLPRSPLFRRVALRAPITDTPQTGSAVRPVEGSLVGERGVASTDLRPAGKGAFGDRTLDVVTEGDYIARGARIEIRELEGNRIVVTRVESGGSEEEERT
jgi:membrane-bound serine protease (ClpP class)